MITVAVAYYAFTRIYNDGGGGNYVVYNIAFPFIVKTVKLCLIDCLKSSNVIYTKSLSLLAGYII